MKKSRGFTLLELMIVVTVIAILAAVALSAYNKQIRKSHRAEAKQLLTDYALREERLRANAATYENTVATLLGSTPTTPDYYNAIAITTPGGNCDNGTAAAIGNSFAITATAKGDQANDSGCTSIVLTSKCGLVSKTPTDCW